VTRVLAAAVLAGLVVTSAASAAPPPLPAAGFDEWLDGAADGLSSTPIPSEGPSVILRLHVRGALTDAAMSARVDRALARLPERARPWLVIHDAPSTTDTAALATWRRDLRALVGRARGRLQGVELSLDDQAFADAAVASFVVRVSAVQVRAASGALLVGVGGKWSGSTPWVRALIETGGAAPYVDAIAVPEDTDAAALRALLDRLAPGIRIAQAAPRLDVETARDAVARTMLARVGTPATVTVFAGSPAALARGLEALTAMADLVGGDIVALDWAASPAAGSQGGRSVWRLLYNATTFSTYLVYWAAPGDDARVVEVDVPVPGELSPMVRVPTLATAAPPLEMARSDARTVRVRLQLDVTPRILDLNYGASPLYAFRDEARGRATLTVDEIVARHQQVQAAQDDLLESYVADARMQQHFRPNASDPGYDVVTDARYYVSREGVEWEERGFSVNGTKWGPDRPAFPLLQAEKVLSLPLDLRLTADYRYVLSGEDRLDGSRCYVVSFEPVRSGSSLYRGRIWIDAERFVSRKVVRVQTSLSAPVVASEEVLHYEPVRDAEGREFWLALRVDGRQTLLIAGRNILLEKDLAMTTIVINPTDFTARRQEARASDRLMYTETDEGLRYFVKEHGTRVVSTRTTNSARALALGFTLDPSYSFPLPMLGLNYLDFAFGNKDTQLAMLFAGVLMLGNVQRAKLLGDKIDGSVDLFAIAVPSGDRLYGQGGERRSERLLTWPLTSGLNLGWQVDPFQKVTASYQFRFDGYVKDRTTSEDFVVPPSTITNGVGGAYEYRRAGYSANIGAMWYQRAGWRDWGPAAALEHRGTRYAKYSASLSKDIFFHVFHKVHLNAAYFGGSSLDRFTRYQFGLFDETRMHGVPSSGVRFGELVMARGSYSFNLLEQYRLDLFLERAVGRQDAGSGRREHVTGVGTAFTLRAPWRTMLRADIGKSFLPRTFDGTGSFVAQVMLLKPL
jgi:hypothetical protein